MERQRKDLLAAFSTKAPDGAWAEYLVELVDADSAKANTFKLEEFIQAMAGKDQAKLWDGISERLSSYIEAVIVPEEDDEERSHGGEDRAAEDSTGKLDSWIAYKTLTAIIMLAQCTLNVNKSTTLPGKLLGTMIALHECLFKLSGMDGEALQAAIVKVCEQWWREERAGGELLVAQTLPYLVAHSLEESARESSIKRLYAMRSALLLFDYDEVATLSFRLLLLQCFLKPTYLCSQEGTRFLTYLFGLHVDFIQDIHRTVKAQLPHAKRKLVKAYGDIYFRAWKAASGVYLETIEQACVQDLMHHATYCASPSLYANLRLFLQSFHSNKRLREVDAMLLRLYNPIIWRSLKVANPLVRAQATGLLIDAFPLQDPNAGTVEVANLLQKQLDTLQTLLIDPDVHVRVAAVAGSSRLLSVYWEAIPLAVIKAYITRLISQLAFDSSSPLVRLAVVEGLTELLTQPLSHPVLATALPLLAPLLHDANLRVRLAFVGLLQKVKGLRDIKYYDIVKVENLLSQLAAESVRSKSSPIADRLIDLLLNSFFPQSKGTTGSKQSSTVVHRAPWTIPQPLPPSVDPIRKSMSDIVLQHVSRCLAFLEQSPAAALAFYSRLYHHVSLGAVTRLAIMLLKCIFATLQPAPSLTSAAESKTGKGGKKGAGPRREKKRTRGETDVDGEGGDGALKGIDQKILNGMLEVAAVLATSVQGDLRKAQGQPEKDLRTLWEQTIAEGDVSNVDTTCAVA